MKILPLTAVCMALTLPFTAQAQNEAAQTTPDETATPAPVTVVFVNTEATQTGTATLTQTRDGVLIELELGALPANQWLGFHIHETAVCDPGTDHESAGAHFNPTGAEHGVLAPGGPHAGDMPNIRSDADGFARVQVFNPHVSMGAGENGLSGRSLMVHGDPDDYRSQPTGNAGDRLACAVIE